MPSALDLTLLHRQHLGLKEVLDQLSRGPRQIKAKENQMAQFDATRVAKEEELKQTRAGADRKNLDLKTNEVKLKDLDRKLNEAGNNREFDILRGQIKADTAANAVLQDEVLELMEKADRIQVEIAGCKESRKQAEVDRDRIKAEFTQKSIALRQQESEFRARIAEAEEPMPVTMIDTYKRLVEAHGADALATSDEGACGSCCIGLTAQQRQILKTGVVMFCRSCGRIMYATR